MAARTAIDRGEHDRAEAIIAGGVHIARPDSDAYWTLRVMRAEVLLTRAKFREAQKELTQEFPRHRKAAVRRLLYLAFAAKELQEGEEREKQLLAAAENLAMQHHRALLAEVYRAKAQLSQEAGDAQKSIDLAQQYRDRSTEAKARATLSAILMRNGDFVGTVDMGERALRMAKELGLINVIQNVEGHLGWAYYDLGDYDRAAELFRSAEAAAAQVGNSLNQSSWLIQLGNIEFGNGNYPGAERYNQRALDIAPRDQERGFALANLARIAIEQASFDKARALNARARQAKVAAGDKDAVLSSDIVDARILTARDRDYVGAEKLLASVIERDSKSNGDPKSSSSLEAQTELAKLYVLWKPDHAEKAFKQAVAIARKQRSEIKHTELRLPFFNTVASLYGAYVDFLVERDPERALEVAEQSRAESLEERRVTGPRRFDLNKLAREQRATILAYWLGHARSYLWVATATETKMHRLPARSRIEAAVDRYQRPIRQGRSTNDGTVLYDMLVAPAKITRNSHVIIVPDGRLHLLSFEALRPAPNRYWIEDVILETSPSLQLLASKARRANASPSLLLVGNPTSPDPVAYPPLKFAAREMRAVEKRFARKTVLEGANATPAAYRGASPAKFDYVHFVAHGVAGTQRPLDAFIQLAPGGSSYKLQARDIQNDTLNARLVTIASCEGAGTRTYAGEGVIGLAWAFLHAGADRVIAALWKVDDLATEKLMSEMYARIAQGHDPDVALREAKLKLLRDPKTANPRYWAPFVLYAGS